MLSSYPINIFVYCDQRASDTNTLKDSYGVRLWWVTDGLAWTTKVQRVFLGKGLLIKTHLISSASLPNFTFQWLLVIIHLSLPALLNWTAWGPAVPSNISQGLNLPSSWPCLLNCEHQNWILYPNAKTNNGKTTGLIIHHAWMSKHHTETWLILVGKITTFSHKPWILVSGIFTPCSGPRSGLAGLNLPYLPYLFIGKPFWNWLCDLRVLESKHKWFKKVTILCSFKALWHFYF